MENEYLSSAVGVPLTQCLAEVVTKQPSDPIEWIAHWLYRYMDNEIYFYEKSIFLKELFKMQLIIERENESRQRNINALRKKMRQAKRDICEDEEELNRLSMDLEEYGTEGLLAFSVGRRTIGGSHSSETSARGSRRHHRDGDGDPDMDLAWLMEMGMIPEGMDLEYLKRHPSMLQKLKNLARSGSQDAEHTQSLLRALMEDPELASLIGTATWKLDCNLGLICQHSVLGRMRGRPPFVPPETPEWWETQGYLERTLYDHEVYSTDRSHDSEPLEWKKLPALTLADFKEMEPSAD